MSCVSLQSQTHTTVNTLDTVSGSSNLTGAQKCSAHDAFSSLARDKGIAKASLPAEYLLALNPTFEPSDESVTWQLRSHTPARYSGSLNGIALLILQANRV